MELGQPADRKKLQRNALTSAVSNDFASFHSFPEPPSPCLLVVCAVERRTAGPLADATWMFMSIDPFRERSSRSIARILTLLSSSPSPSTALTRPFRIFRASSIAPPQHVRLSHSPPFERRQSSHVPRVHRERLPVLFFLFLVVERFSFSFFFSSRLPAPSGLHARRLPALLPPDAKVVGQRSRQRSRPVVRSRVLSLFLLLV